MTSASLHVRPESFANKSTWAYVVAAVSRVMARRPRGTAVAGGSAAMTKHSVQALAGAGDKHGHFLNSPRSLA